MQETRNSGKFHFQTYNNNNLTMLFAAAFPCLAFFGKLCPSVLLGQDHPKCQSFLSDWIHDFSNLKNIQLTSIANDQKPTATLQTQPLSFSNRTHLRVHQWQIGTGNMILDLEINRMMPGFLTQMQRTKKVEMLSYIGATCSI